jgi:hypothetical protein
MCSKSMGPHKNNLDKSNSYQETQTHAKNVGVTLTLCPRKLNLTMKTQTTSYLVQKSQAHA